VCLSRRMKWNVTVQRQIEPTFWSTRLGMIHRGRKTFLPPYSLLQLLLQIRADLHHLSWKDSLVPNRKIKLLLLKNNCVLLAETASNPTGELSQFAGDHNSKDDCEVHGAGV
jgi:hypothetical protein